MARGRPKKVESDNITPQVLAVADNIVMPETVMLPESITTEPLTEFELYQSRYTAEQIDNGIDLAKSAVQGTDPRLTDSRNPLPHNHTKVNITDFAHTHDPDDITDGLIVAGTNITTSRNATTGAVTINSTSGISDAPIDNIQYGRQNGAWTAIEEIKQFNFRGEFQLGNTYNINDVVSITTPDSVTEFIANMNGIVLPPPSMGWDEFFRVRNGKSAYELAVEAGFNGTLEEWLESLQGTDGTNATINGLNVLNIIDSDTITTEISNNNIKFHATENNLTAHAIDTTLHKTNGEQSKINNLPSDTISDLERVELIAKGASRALVFETLIQLNNWIAGAYIRPDEKTIDDLRIGDNLFIIDRFVPDYWWDGTQKQELETQKVDLTDYPKTAEVQNMIAVLANNVLQKNNTTAFTPTANYHPATKLYVDNSKMVLPPNDGKAYVMLNGAWVDMATLTWNERTG